MAEDYYKMDDEDEEYSDEEGGDGDNEDYDEE